MNQGYETSRTLQPSTRTAGVARRTGQALVACGNLALAGHVTQKIETGLENDIAFRYVWNATWCGERGGQYRPWATEVGGLVPLVVPRQSRIQSRVYDGRPSVAGGLTMGRRKGGLRVRYSNGIRFGSTYKRRTIENPVHSTACTRRTSGRRGAGPLNLGSVVA